MGADFGLYAQVVRAGWRLMHPGWKVEGTLPDGPAVLVIHHQNLFGPVCAEALLPESPHLWVLQPFTERKACFQQYRSYTFSVRFGWPPPAAVAAAGLLSLTIPPLMASIKAIPVYRDRREVLDTLDQSMRALSSGEKVLLCPDMDYADGTPALGALYTGFLHLEKQWFRQTGEHLSFVPLYGSKRRRRLVVGASLHFSGTQPFSLERSAIAAALQQEINRIGRDCGDIILKSVNSSFVE